MDLVNQSIPFSFLSVEVSANDGGPHQVQLLTSVSGDWVSQAELWDDREDFVHETTTGRAINHRVWFKNQTQLTGVNRVIRYGSVIYSTKQVTGSRAIRLGIFSKLFRSAERPTRQATETSSTGYSTRLAP